MTLFAFRGAKSPVRTFCDPIKVKVSTCYLTYALSSLLSSNDGFSSSLSDPKSHSMNFLSPNRPDFRSGTGSSWRRSPENNQPRSPCSPNLPADPDTSDSSTSSSEDTSHPGKPPLPKRDPFPGSGASSWRLSGDNSQARKVLPPVRERFATGDSSLSIFSGVTIHFTSLSMLAGLNRLKKAALPLS